MKDEMIEKKDIDLEGESGSGIALTETRLKSRLTTFFAVGDRLHIPSLQKIRY